MITIPAGTGFCDEETTQFLLWPETPAGTTRSLPCPNTTTIVDRTCNLPGIWDDVDLSLCRTGFCDQETTQFLLWPETPAGTTRFLPCPNTTTIINRTCNLPSNWDDVDPSLCIPISSIDTVSIRVGDSKYRETYSRPCMQYQQSYTLHTAMCFKGI